MMNVLTQYSISTRRFEIFTPGCFGVNGKHCEDCHNKDLFDFKKGIPLSPSKLKQIISTIENSRDLISSIHILGGEPLDQSIYELEYMMIQLHKLNIPVILFTGKYLKDVPHRIRVETDFIKCGMYCKNKTSDDYESYGIKLASTNQKVYKRGLDY